jgi:AsmA protein
MRWLKIVALALAGLLAVLLLAIAVFWWRFDPNAWRAWVGRQVAERTGRELVIEGDLRLALLPELSIDVNRLKLANATGFGPAPFLSADRVRAALRLWPLLRGRVEAGEFSIEGLEVSLARDANGRTNWQDLLEKLPKSTDSAPKYTISAVNVQGATVTWSDAQAGRHWRVGDLSLTTGRVAPPEPFQCVTQFTLTELPGEPLARVHAEARVSVDTVKNRYGLAELAVNGEWWRVPGQAPLPVALQAGSLSVDLGPLSGDAQGLVIDAAGAHLTAEVTARNLAEMPEIGGQLAAAPFDLRAALAALGIAAPETADPKALSHAAFQAQFSLQGNAIRLQQMTAELDDSNLRGELAVQLDETPAFAFDLTADRMDVDRYLAPTQVKRQTKAVAESMSSPLDSLRKLEAEGVIEIGEARLAGMQVQDAHIELETRNNRVALTKTKPQP